MDKKIIAIALGVAVVLMVIGLFVNNMRVSAPASMPAAFDPTNATYTIDDQSVALVNGKASVAAAPGSAEQVTTSIFGEPVRGDINGDGTADAALILVQDSGGSGTFYYAAAAINATSGAQGTNAILLGDRIAPQNIEIQNGEILANYADREPGQPMSATPSVGTTKYLQYENSLLVEIPLQAEVGEHCGGNMTTAVTCATGLHCAAAPGSHLPVGDVGGVCVVNPQDTVSP